MVTPNGNYPYPGWPQGEYRRVLEVRLEPYEGRFWVLVVLKPGASMVSSYNPHNFEKQECAEMAYEKTKFFAMKMNPGQLPGNATDLGLRLYPVMVGSLSDIHSDAMTTPLRDSRHEVRVDVTKLIAEGDRWLVVQTVCLIEGEEPRPPIRVTEYK